MATDKLVDFDHVTDYIRREDAVQCAVDIEADLFNDGSYGASAGASTVGIWLKNLPAADVRPVVRCKDCIHAPLPGDCEGNDMEWPKIDGIYEDCTCPHCCADNWYSTRPDPDGFCEKGKRREPNLDTTKGERRDESSG